MRLQNAPNPSHIPIIAHKMRDENKGSSPSFN